MGVLTEMKVLVPDGENNYTYNEGHNNDIRAYMAINPKNQNGNPEEKVLLVGTEKIEDPTAAGGYLYKDIIHKKTWSKGDTLELGDGDEDSGVYDFTNPCPEVCDDGSPLNGDE